MCKKIKLNIIRYSELHKNIIKSQIEFEFKQNIILNNIINNYNLLLQQFISSSNLKNVFLLNLDKIPKPPSNQNINNINVQKDNKNIALLNKKHLRKIIINQK